MKKTDLKEILQRADVNKLIQFLLDYSSDHQEFEMKLRNKFSPKTVQVAAIKDYPSLIRRAFYNNALRSRGRYYSDWDEYGFDADGVRNDLEKILDDVDYFLNNKNVKIAAEICKSMIEIIPEEWDEQFDYEGDVQVMYDEAIDKLQMMLTTDLFSAKEKEALFEWYKEESQDLGKHEYIGLNTDLNILQQYFLSSEEMIEQNLKSLDEKIKQSSEGYHKERFIVKKINLLKEVNRLEEMLEAIEKYIEYVSVRRIKMNRLIDNKEYNDAVDLVLDGIEIAEKMSHPGTVNDWKDELLKIAQLKNDKNEILKLSEELLYKGRDAKKYYDILKSETPQKDWDKTLTRVLKKMETGKGVWQFNRLRADILIEHQKWDELFNQCVVGGIENLAEFEKYLRPVYNNEIFEIYVKHIEKTAEITDQRAYESVAGFLARLLKFPGGKQKVKELVDKYRIIYKRRKNMIKELERF